jgi:GH25 family lysozyme M1 (1,4-beta-N-acetylmuramidase)
MATEVLGMGVDVSHYQGFIDWKAVVDAIHVKGYYAIAIIKASGGDQGLYQDAQYLNNKANARKYADAVGFYHFMGNQFTPAQEADFFLKTLNGDILQHEFLCMDAESGQTDAQKLAFESELKKLTAVNGLDYPQDNDQVLHGANFGTWVARYGLNLGGIPSWPFTPKTVYVIWQYTSQGNIAGINGNVDMDLCSLPLKTLQLYGKK